MLYEGDQLVVKSFNVYVASDKTHVIQFGDLAAETTIWMLVSLNKVVIKTFLNGVQSDFVKQTEVNSLQLVVPPGTNFQMHIVNNDPNFQLSVSFTFNSANEQTVKDTGVPEQQPRN